MVRRPDPAWREEGDGPREARPHAGGRSPANPCRAAIRRAVQARLAHGLRPADKDRYLPDHRIAPNRASNGPEQAQRVERAGSDVLKYRRAVQARLARSTGSRSRAKSSGLMAFSPALSLSERAQRTALRLAGQPPRNAFSLTTIIIAIFSYNEIACRRP